MLAKLEDRPCHRETPMKTGSFLAAVLFSLVALAHLLRLVTGTPVMVGETSVSMWISVLGVILPAAIAWLLWRESR
jgi:protein-S-isoprenylcysteine O-methyltransferase Ste14